MVKTTRSQMMTHESSSELLSKPPLVTEPHVVTETSVTAPLNITRQTFSTDSRMVKTTRSEMMTHEVKTTRSEMMTHEVKTTRSQMMTHESSSETEDDGDDEEDVIAGFLAWALVTTISMIVIIMKWLLRHKLKCCTRHQSPTTPPPHQNPAYTPSPSCSPLDFNMQVLHTPPSQATSPAVSSTASTSTCKPLISPGEKVESPVASRTRSKRKLSL